MRAITRGQRRIRLEELCQLPTFWAPSVSWSGNKVAFFWDKTGQLEIHVLDLLSGELRQLTHGEAPRAIKFPSLIWDREDRALVFHRDREGNEKHDLYRIDLAAGEIRALTRDSRTWQIPIEFSPDNRWLSFIAGREQPDHPQASGQLNLWRMTADGSELVPLTHFAAFTSGGYWSPDGQWLAVDSNEELDDLNNIDAYVVRSDGSDLRRVYRGNRGSKDAAVGWHPDGRQVALVSDASGTCRVGILRLNDRTDVRWLTPEGITEGEVGLDRFARFSPDGRRLLTLRNQESQILPVVYEVADGSSRILPVPPGVTTYANFVKGGNHVLVLHSSDAMRPSFLLYDIARDRLDTVLGAEYGSLDPSIFVEAKHVYYPSRDGAQVPALLYVPHGASGSRLPAVVHIHGGPTSQWFRNFDPFAQFLVDLGLVVLEPNIRGSTGYGVEYRNAALHDWGGKDLDDVAGAVTFLKTRPDVDPDRIIAFGGSYGGFMTFMAVTKKPDLWHAGIAWVGITDLKRMYDVSQPFFQYFLRQQMGDPGENAGLWADRSAINFADRLKAKLLMVHGANDARCPVEQSRIFRDRLRQLGRREGEDFEYVEFADEGHGSNDIQQKIRTFTVLAEYLDRVL